MTASAQFLVTCYEHDMCSSSGLLTFIQFCCDNVNSGGLGGIAYQLDGIEGCILCPVG